MVEPVSNPYKLPDEAASELSDGLGRCRTCKHWKTPTGEGCYHESDLCDFRDPTTFEILPGAPYEVRICKHPDQGFCERPIGKDGFSIADGSTYFACLATAEDFGCVRHETA